ncbi:hypothetical protein EYF80_006657 [Liparis tanakae]|uniref:Uncharacterized protein n=1 Tax=Liparis tanakae TaxID=230148 RepID=A0A4Z2IYJ4_9TELE|nr:hypothetical protein EYF80_006657 [Liparis tanakae]
MWSRSVYSLDWLSVGVHHGRFDVDKAAAQALQTSRLANSLYASSFLTFLPVGVGRNRFRIVPSHEGNSGRIVVSVFASRVKYPSPFALSPAQLRRRGL